MNFKEWEEINKCKCGLSDGCHDCHYTGYLCDTGDVNLILGQQEEIKKLKAELEKATKMVKDHCCGNCCPSLVCDECEVKNWLNKQDRGEGE